MKYVFSGDADLEIFFQCFNFLVITSSGRRCILRGRDVAGGTD